MHAPGMVQCWQPRKHWPSWPCATADDFTASKQVASPGKTITHDSVSITYHPAGHVLGSAQICVEKNGLRIVASGDYKRQPDPTCAGFEPVVCDVFITEATFALPVFRHPEYRSGSCPPVAFGAAVSRAHAYGSGPTRLARRSVSSGCFGMPVTSKPSTSMALWKSSARSTNPVEWSWDHSHRQQSILQTTTDFAGAIVVAPPGSLNDRWARRFADPLNCFASGWMRIRQRAKQRGRRTAADRVRPCRLG